MSETSVEIVDLECDNIVSPDAIVHRNNIVSPDAIVHHDNIVSPDAIVHRNNIVSSNAIMLGMRNVTQGEAILIVMLFCIVML